MWKVDLHPEPGKDNGRDVHLLVYSLSHTLKPCRTPYAYVILSDDQ